jgi:hypothetical protein
MLKKLSREILIRIIELLVSEYLKTRPNDDGEEFYDSYHGHAERELNGFLDWVREEAVKD